MRSSVLLGQGVGMTAKRPSYRRRFALAHPLFSEKFESELSKKYAFKMVLEKTRAKTRGGVWWKWSPYHAWFECLRHSERYRECCENGGTGPLSALYADFGDVRIDFKEWWQQRIDPNDRRTRGEALFAEPEESHSPSPKNVRSISLAEIDQYRSSIESQKTLLVCVPSGVTKEDAVRAFREQFGKWKGTAGRGAYRKNKQSRAEQSQAKYRPQSGGVIHVGAILNDLHVFNLMRAEVGSKKWLEVFKKLRLNDIDNRWPEGNIETTRLKIIRCQRNAEALVKGVEEGRFPIYARSGPKG